MNEYHQDYVTFDPHKVGGEELRPPLKNIKKT